MRANEQREREHDWGERLVLVLVLMLMLVQAQVQERGWERVQLQRWMRVWMWMREPHQVRDHREEEEGRRRLEDGTRAGGSSTRVRRYWGRQPATAPWSLE